MTMARVYRMANNTETVEWQH